MSRERPRRPTAFGTIAYTPHAVQAQCRLVSENASDMLSVHALDDGFTYRYASPASERIFGYGAGELVGRSAFHFIHPDDRAIVEEAAARLRERDETVTTTYRFRSKSGPYMWVESTCRLVPDPETGMPVEVIATTRSAEARIAAEADRARLLYDADIARAAAESANRRKDQFLAMMSHELRTPLNAIAGHLQLLELGIHGPLTDAQRHSLGRIDLAQRYLLRLVDDLLGIERLRSGKLDYDMRPVRIRELVQELEPMIGPQLAAKSIVFAVDVAHDDVATADHDKLAQVLINLVSNATKFTPAGGSVTIDCPHRDDGTGSDAPCYIRVRDTGIGIPEAKRSVIFEPFVQVQVTPSTRSEGAGLGLAISRELSRGMGGELRVRSIEGVGTSFTIDLPRAAPERLESRVER